MGIVSKRVADKNRRVLHLIKMWLECAVEETDERGRKTRTTEAKDTEWYPTRLADAVEPVHAAVYVGVEAAGVGA
jgi:hypothetical protein